MQTWEQHSSVGQRKEWTFILIFVVLAASIIGIGYLSYQSYRQHFRTEVDRQLSAIADLKVNVLTQWRLERLGNGDLFYKNLAFATLIKRCLDNPEDEDAQCQLQDWIGKVQMYNRYDHIRLLDAQGATRISIPAGQPPVTASILKLIPEILGTGQVIFQDFYRNEHNQRIYLAELVPIRDPADDNRPLGVLELCIDPENYLYPFLKRWPAPTLTAETLLFRQEGNEAVFLNDLRFQPNAALNLRVPVERVMLPATQATLGRAGVMEGVDYRGVPVVAAVRTIPDSPWQLVTRMDAAEVYLPLRAWLWQTVILIGALLLGALACVVLMWRQQLVRFYKERYTMAEALRASDIRYRRLFEAAKDGILIFDAETGTIVDVNPFLINLLDSSREDFLGKQVWELRLFKHLADSEANFLKLQHKENLHFEELPLEAANGRRMDVEFVSYSYVVNHRKVIQCTIRDITEAKRAAAERAQHEAQTRQLQKTESLGRMAGAIAHHFNNKLQVVIGNLEQVLAGLPRDAKAAASLGDALHAAQQAANISGLMLTYLGKAPRENKPLYLAEFCRHNLPLLRSAMPVVLEANLATPGPVINANASQVQQVLSNLVTNAWESGGTNRGAVRLSVKTVPAGEISTRHRFPVDWQPQAQTYACLAVVDAGCGIADAHIDQLFDPFFSTKLTGRGLGLAVVLGIMRAHAGVITVESEPILGSAFRVFFPVLEPAALRLPEEAQHIPELTGGGTVLVVEDDEPVRKLAAAMLASLGFAVLTAQNGVEAVEVFQQHQPEIRCVLTDLTMPRRNGWETIAALRALRADLPIILASGYDEASVMAGEHPERPQAILSKPYKIQELRDALARAIGVRQAKAA